MAGIENIFQITLQHYIVLGLLVFFIGFLIVALRDNLIVKLMGIEVMMNGANIVLISISQFSGESSGEILSFFILSLAAAEAGLGLALVVNLLKIKESLSVKYLTKLKG